jgi:RNA polymerase sigma-70 factor (ECF subfamily)
MRTRSLAIARSSAVAVAGAESPGEDELESRHHDGRRPGGEKRWADLRDADLLQATASGEEEAFAEIYRRYHGRVYRFAYHMTGSVAAAEDVTHSSFLSLLESPRRYRPERAALSTYLCAAARNQNLKRLRRTRREVLSAETPEDPRRDGPLEALIAAERTRVVRDAILRLAPLHREVVILFEIEDLDLATVAQIVGADVGTVKVRLHRARTRLKQWLGSDQRTGVSSSERRR